MGLELCLETAKHKNAIPVDSNFSLSFPSIDAAVMALEFNSNLSDVFLLSSILKSLFF